MLWPGEKLRAVRASIANESAERRRARIALRQLQDAIDRLQAATTPDPSGPHALAALRREAVRVASQVIPFPALADGENGRLALSRLVEDGLDRIDAASTEETLTIAATAHERALQSLEATVVEERALVRRSQLTLATAAVAICLSIAVGSRVASARFGPTDLAAGKPWTTSSTWAECHPEQNECGKFPTRILFHTHQQLSPWFQIDLQGPTTFSSATIVNRQDMAMPLALPLVLEVSDDGTTFREVIRQTGHFSVWQPTFAPQTARYFRLRVDRISTLHLESVKVHP